MASDATSFVSYANLLHEVPTYLETSTKIIKFEKYIYLSYIVTPEYFNKPTDLLNIIIGCFFLNR